MIEDHKESIEDARQKHEITAYCCKQPYERTFNELKLIGKFFSQYSFFKQLKQNHDSETYHGVMRYIKFMPCITDEFLIREGDDGDKFYVIIDG